MGHMLQRDTNYSEVKKITSFFQKQTRSRRIGNVYKGSLCNGSHVAVKVLNGLKGNGEDFINEVASISKTSHVNIVSLVGFCLRGCKRALIYEFMPNGSLEKFSMKKDPKMFANWVGQYVQIGLGIARGLEYLHREHCKFGGVSHKSDVIVRNDGPRDGRRRKNVDVELIARVRSTFHMALSRLNKMKSFN
ncbi:hypothetical protein P3L10_031478 [Capsicum annuum]